MPEGVVNVVAGPGSTAGARLVEHPDVAKVAFTGSTAVGARDRRRGGGDDQARDARAGRQVGQRRVRRRRPRRPPPRRRPRAVFGNAGQDCCARSRILVERSALDAFMDALEEAVEAVRVGDPLDEATEMGPLISADQRETVAAFVPADAPVAIRGTAPDGPGFWFPPTVLCPVDRDDRAVREEIFGPVAVVIPFRDEAEAVALANDTIYGLSGSIWTRDGAKALRVARAVETGVLVDQRQHVGAGVDAVRRLQAVRLRARARARTRSITTRRSSRCSTRHEAARGQGLRDHRAPRAGSAPWPPRASARRARPSSASTCTATSAGVDLALAADVADEDAVQRRCTRARASECGSSTCSSTTPASRPPTTPRCSTRRSTPGSACRTSTRSRSSCAASTASRTCSTAAAAR